MRVAQFAFVPARGGVLAAGGRLPLLEDGWEAHPPSPFLRKAAHVELEPGHAVRLRVFEPVDEAGTPGERVTVPPALRDAFERCLAEHQARIAIPEQRPAWSRPGFHAEAEAWAGMRLELVRNWPLSAVLRNGDTYFKAVFSIFRHEPAITAAVEVAPRVLRADEQRGWMLLEAAHGDDPDPLEAVRRMAQVHRDWSSRVDEALALGAHDRRAPSEVAPTLVHGDFHLGNVVGSTIIDWSDAAIANPLYDVNYFAFTLGDDARRDEVIAAYGDDRADAYEAESYEYVAQSYVGIAAACAPDDRWWFEGEPERWLRRAGDVRAGRRPSLDT
jgi:hypothetical protein